MHFSAFGGVFAPPEHTEMHCSHGAAGRAGSGGGGRAAGRGYGAEKSHLRGNSGTDEPSGHETHLSYGRRGDGKGGVFLRHTCHRRRRGGNGPAYFHESCDLETAVKRVMDSKTFDNGTICASEQSVVTVTAFAGKVQREFERQGGYFLSKEQRDILAGFVLRGNGTMNPAIVGKSVAEVCRLAGLRGIPDTARVLLASEDGVGKGHPFSNEKLGLILAYYVEQDEEHALKRCVEILRHEGAGHTFAIHANDERVVEKFARAVPASRVLVNTPAALGGIGATTCLFPALTLGCGAVGGSSSSNNIGPLDLVNIKRVAWGVRELEDLKGGEGTCGDRQNISQKELTWIIAEALRQLK